MKAENCTYPWSAFGFQLCAFHILCICSHGLMLCVSTRLLLSMHVCVYTADSKHACVLCGANHVWLLLRCAVSLSTSPSVATGSERQSTELPDIWKSKNDSLLRLDQCSLDLHIYIKGPCHFSHYMSISIGTPLPCLR